MKKIRFLEIIIVIILLFFFMPFILKMFGINTYVIISGSMMHKNLNESFFNEFMESQGVIEVPYKKGINPGDIILVKQTKDYNVGDIVMYPGSTYAPVKSHRLLSINKTHFKAKGDRDISPIRLNKTSIDKIFTDYKVDVLPTKRLMGKVVLRIPNLGMLKMLGVCSTKNMCNLKYCFFQKECRILELT